jgi:hypothetical protein
VLSLSSSSDKIKLGPTSLVYLVARARNNNTFGAVRMFGRSFASGVDGGMNAERGCRDFYVSIYNQSLFGQGQTGRTLPWRSTANKVPLTSTLSAALISSHLISCLRCMIFVTGLGPTAAGASRLVALVT